jgi:hypothetical protein
VVQNVVVDPYVIDALFQEILAAPDNAGDIGSAESTSAASNTYTPALGTVSKQLHFEWNYDISQPGLAGYILYQNGESLFIINDPTTLSIDDTVNVEPGQTVIFTITAFDVNGNESAISAPYSFDIPLEVAKNNLLPPVDGSDSSAGYRFVLYNSECAGCRSPLNNSAKLGRSAANIQAAIDNNVGTIKV